MVDAHLTYKNNQTSLVGIQKCLVDALFYYTEGVKPMISQHKMWGKVTKYNYNAEGIELNVTQNTIDRVLTNKNKLYCTKATFLKANNTMFNSVGVVIVACFLPRILYGVINGLMPLAYLKHLMFIS